MSLDLCADIDVGEKMWTCLGRVSGFVSAYIRNELWSQAITSLQARKCSTSFITEHFLQPLIRRWSSWWKFLLRYTMSVQAAIDGAEVWKSTFAAFYGTLIVTKYSYFVSMDALGCAMFSAKRFGSRHVWDDDIWGARCLMRAHWVTLYLVWLACVVRCLAWIRLGCAPLSRAEPCKAAISGAEVGVKRLRAWDRHCPLTCRAELRRCFMNCSYRPHNQFLLLQFSCESAHQVGKVEQVTTSSVSLWIRMLHWHFIMPVVVEPLNDLNNSCMCFSLMQAYWKISVEIHLIFIFNCRISLRGPQLDAQPILLKTPLFAMLIAVFITPDSGRWLGHRQPTARALFFWHTRRTTSLATLTTPRPTGKLSTQQPLRLYVKISHHSRQVLWMILPFRLRRIQLFVFTVTCRGFLLNSWLDGQTRSLWSVEVLRVCLRQLFLQKPESVSLCWRLQVTLVRRVFFHYLFLFLCVRVCVRDREGKGEWEWKKGDRE